MPLILRNLAPQSPATRPPTGAGEAVGFGGPTIWTYRTQDAAATVDTVGYFNGAADLLRNGDLIYRATIDANGVVQTAGFHTVNSIAAGVVDVTDTLALTMTDTD